MLRLPPRRRNLNVGGSVHGAAIMALAETVHGVAVLWQFSPVRHVMVTKTAHIEFLARVHTQLRTSFGLTSEAHKRIDTALATRGLCEIELESNVVDVDGRRVARLVATYQIRRLGARS